MTTMTKALGLAAAVVVAVLVAGTTAAAEPERGPEIGAVPPDFTLESVTGGEHTLSENRGKRPVVLVFFRGAW